MSIFVSVTFLLTHSVETCCITYMTFNFDIFKRVRIVTPCHCMRQNHICILIIFTMLVLCSHCNMQTCICLRCPCLHGSMPSWLAECKGCRYRRSIAFVWHHYHSPEEMKIRTHYYCKYSQVYSSGTFHKSSNFVYKKSTLKLEGSNMGFCLSAWMDSVVKIPY